MAPALAPTRALRAGPRPAPDPRLGVIYLRVSTGPQEKHGFGLTTQEKACRALAEREGIQVVEVIRDVDSGTQFDLPGVHRLLDLAEAGAFGTAIVYDPDRLSRSLSKYVWLDTQLTACGVQAHYVTVGAARTDEEKLFHEIKAVFAQHDHRRIVRRMANGKRDKAAAGHVVGTGEAPYGYRYLLNDKGKQYALAVDEDWKPIVQRIFRDVVHHSLQTICDALNAEGIMPRHQDRPPRRGGHKAGWHPSTLRTILDNPVYLGRPAYGRRAGKAAVPVPDTSQWIYSAAPALVTQAEWDAAHAALDRRHVLRTRRARLAPDEDPYLLRGALTCGHCGGALRCKVLTGRDRAPVRYYSCLRAASWWARTQERERCPLPDVLASGLDALAWQDVATALLDPAKLQDGMAAAQEEYQQGHTRRAEQLAALDREIAASRARLSRILDEQLDAPAGSETARLLAEKARQIELRLTTLQADRERLAAAPHVGLSDAQVITLMGFAAEVRAGLVAATIAERRKVLGLLQLRGAVRADEQHGCRLGRRHRFAVDWQAAIPVSHSGGELVNSSTNWSTRASSRSGNSGR